MKKIICFTTLVLAGTTMNAQKTTWGLKAGYALSTLKNDSPEAVATTYTSDPLHTFYIGGLVQHQLGSKFGVQGELLYAPLGGSQSFEFRSDTMYSLTETQLNLETLQIPLSGQYFINDAFSVSAGVNFGFVLSAKLRYVAYESHNVPGTELSVIPDDEYDVKNQMNSLLFAPFAGVSYTLGNGLFFEARYHQGLSDLSKTEGKLTNSFLQAGVGYRFGRGQ